MFFYHPSSVGNGAGEELARGYPLPLALAVKQ